MAGRPYPLCASPPTRHRVLPQDIQADWLMQIPAPGRPPSPASELVQPVHRASARALAERSASAPPWPTPSCWPSRPLIARHFGNRRRRRHHRGGRGHTRFHDACMAFAAELRLWLAAIIPADLPARSGHDSVCEVLAHAERLAGRPGRPQRRPSLAAGQGRIAGHSSPTPASVIESPPATDHFPSGIIGAALQTSRPKRTRRRPPVEEG